MLVHASCVAIDQKAVLLFGDSGVGKSDLALRMIDGGAVLVSDDQTLLSIKDGCLIASPPVSIAGMMEIRHIGLVKMPFLQEAKVALAIELLQTGEGLDRLPETDHVLLLDHPVQRLRLHSLYPSTPAKIRAVIAYMLEA